MSEERKTDSNAARSCPVLLTFKAAYDLSDEPGGILRCRVQTSASRDVCDVDIEEPQFTATLPWPVAAAQPIAQHIFFADLFAMTVSDLDGVLLPCRHVVARATWTVAEMVENAPPVELRTMSQSSSHAVKGYLTPRFPAGRRPSATDVATATAIKKRVTQITELAAQCSRQANQAFRSAHQWLTVKGSKFTSNRANVSYIDLFLAPDSCGNSMYHVPDWVLHVYLWTAPLPRNELLLAYFRHALNEVCRKHGFTAAEFLSVVGKPQTANDALLGPEILGSLLVHWVVALVYCHDFVSTGNRKTEDVDDYDVPRTMPNREQAGDDCESVAMDALRSYVELLNCDLSGAQGPTDKALAYLQRLAGEYICFQATGHLAMGRGQDLECHSWLIMVDRGRVGQWLKRGADKQASTSTTRVDESKHHPLTRRAPTGQGNDEGGEKKSSGSAPSVSSSSTAVRILPTICLEATESLSCARWKWPEATEMTYTRFWKAFDTCDSSPAFHAKRPWTVVEAEDRYRSVTSLVSYQMFKDMAKDAHGQACEFIPCSTVTGQRGVTYHELFAGDTIELLPVMQLDSKHMAMAREVATWLRPLSALRAPLQTMAASETKADVKRGIHGNATHDTSQPRIHVSIRKSDWPMCKADFESWATGSGYSIQSSTERCVADRLVHIEHVLVEKDS